jgi:hypothetical protein
MTIKNKITKTWDGRIVDDHNNLHVVEAFNDHGTMKAGNTYIMERHGRIAPVLVTSTVWNAMQKACAAYNSNR